MTKRGRPRKDVVVFRVTLRLGSGDGDLIEFLRAAPKGNRVAAIKAAMRGGINFKSVEENQNDNLSDAVNSFLM